MNAIVPAPQLLIGVILSRMPSENLSIGSRRFEDSAEGPREED